MRRLFTDSNQWQPTKIHQQQEISRRMTMARILDKKKKSQKNLENLIKFLLKLHFSFWLLHQFFWQSSMSAIYYSYFVSIGKRGDHTIEPLCYIFGHWIRYKPLNRYKHDFFFHISCIFVMIDVDTIFVERLVLTKKLKEKKTKTIVEIALFSIRSFYPSGISSRKI